MNRVISAYMRHKHPVKSARTVRAGQTMTEYALILAAVAIVAYITYQVMGQDVGSMVNVIDNALSNS